MDRDERDEADCRSWRGASSTGLIGRGIWTFSSSGRELEEEDGGGR